MYFNYLITQIAHHTFRGKWFSFMYSIGVNTPGSQYVTKPIKIDLKMTD